MNEIRWLFFDIGYTLINEDRAHDERINAILPSLARKGISTDEFRQAMRDASLAFASSPFHAAARKFGIEEKVRYPKELEFPYGDAAGVLERLSADFSLGVIANQSCGGYERLVHGGLSQYFKIFVLSAEDGVAKPDPGIYRLAVERAGCLPCEALMIGDRLDNDVRPAKSIGMYTIRLLQGVAAVQRAPDESWMPDATVSCLNDIPSAATLLAGTIV